MDKTRILDRLIGLDAHVAHMIALGKELQQSPSDRMRTFGNHLHRNAKGVQVAIATIRQEAQHSSS